MDLNRCKLLKLEVKMLVSLCIISLSTYLIAILNNFNLSNLDYYGIISLVLSLLICFIKPKFLSKTILVILILGSFNCLSFFYFININLSGGFLKYLFNIKIQLIPLILLLFFLYKKYITDKSNKN